jgi:hypothetical protein
MTWLVAAFLLGALGLTVFFLVEQDKNGQRNYERLRAAIRQLDEFPDDSRLTLNFIRLITGLQLPPAGHELAIPRALAIVSVNQRNGTLLAQYLEYFRQSGAAEFHYRQLLALLANDSGPVYKNFVLQAARCHYGSLRQDNKLTIYDEQAIQNDILVSTAA